MRNHIQSTSKTSSPIAPKRNAFSCGVIPVLRGKEPGDEPLFLLLRVYQYWDFPKGGAEKGEAPLETARRELVEETGIQEVSFPWGEVFIETEPYAHGKIARYYVGEVTDKAVELLINPVLGHPEHHEYRWCTYEEAKTLVVPRVAQVLDWAYYLLLHGF